MLHPSIFLLLWLIASALIQVLAPALLVIGLGLALLVSGARIRQQARHLLQRTRWLLVVLLATYLWMTPGEYVMSGIPVTMEGLEQGGLQSLRLLSMIYAVSVLVVVLPPARFLSATWSLTGRGRWSGVRRALTRLALVLEESDQLAHQRMNWHALLADAQLGPNGDQSKEQLALEIQSVPNWQWGMVMLAAAIAVLLGRV